MSDIVGNWKQGVDGRKQNCFTEEFETERGLCGGTEQDCISVVERFLMILGCAKA
jgi:hypothetical protein